MAATSTTQLRAGVSNLPLGGTLDFEDDVETNSNSPGDSQTITLTTTPTALAIPSGTKQILIKPPSGNTTNVAIGGTGVALANMQLCDPTGTIKIPCIASSPACLVACATGTVANVKVYFL
jgi:hypothetical protein